jgi:hypothetical protein
MPEIAPSDAETIVTGWVPLFTMDADRENVPRSGGM